MNKNLDWSKIKGGFRGFEQLAFDYVEDNYSTSQVKWNKTKETRDGNKDGYSIVLGYQPSNLAAEEWWMEAKYSTQQKVLSRYRLDATIVSAAIQGHVTKVIFVTNITIGTKTIVDIRAALKRTLHCGEVHFCTKNTLELWLFKRKKFFDCYFDPADWAEFKMSELFLSDGMEWFSGAKRNQIFSEPLKILRKEQEYYVYFSVFSDSPKTLMLRLSNDVSGIEILSSKTISLTSGENIYWVRLAIMSDFSICYTYPDLSRRVSRDTLDGCILYLGDLEIISKRALSVIDAHDTTLMIPSQERLLHRLTDGLETFQREYTPHYISVTGRSGVGKSFSLEKFISGSITPEHNFLHIVFSDDIIENQQLVRDILGFILFPYLPPRSIDNEYFERITMHNVHSVTKTILFKLFNDLDPDQLNTIFAQHKQNQNIFPAKLQINERLIVLDDIHKLDGQTAHFIAALFIELFRKRVPVFLIAAGWPEFLRTAAYQTIAQRVVITQCSLSLSTLDLQATIQEKEILPFQLNENILEIIFPSVIELIQFFRYCKTIKIYNLQEFLIAAQSFLNADLATEYILAPFWKLFEYSASLKELCDAIYWLPAGSPVSERLSKDERTLLEHEVARISPDGGRLVPVHDRYQRIYRVNFSRPESLSAHFIASTAYKLQNILLFGTNQESLENAVHEISEMKKAGRFFSLSHTLTDVFEKSNIPILRAKLDEYNFFLIYLAYAFGVANQSKTKSGKDVFKDIYALIINVSDFKVRQIEIEVLFELANSEFEWLNHGQAGVYIAEIKKLAALLQEFEILAENLYTYDIYVLAEATEHYINSENEIIGTREAFKLFSEKIGNSLAYEALFIQLRYAETQYLHDTDHSLSSIRTILREIEVLRGSKDKFYLWAKMDIAFLEFVLTNKSVKILEIKTVHELLRDDFYNDYRKRTFAIANCYLSKGMVKEAAFYIFAEYIQTRQLRPRQLAFYYETLALYEQLNGREQQAQAALKEAEEIFCHLPSYSRIVQHNKKLIACGSFVRDKIAFCINDQALDTFYYYIDPRCIW